MGKKETKAQREARVKKILDLLDQEYGTEYRCYLNHETPWQLFKKSLEWQPASFMPVF